MNLNQNDFNEYTFADKDKKKWCLIGNDVWIGSNVTILNGIRIANGSIIASGAVVTKNTEAYGI